jgi:Mrp family chromosome partitioning ATPase
MEPSTVHHLAPETAHAPKGADAAAARQVDLAWAQMGALDVDVRRLRRARIVTLTRSDPAHTGFDILRTRVLRSLRQNGWTTVAITSPTPGCGKSVIALNLAFGLARLSDCRTVCLDLDFRQHRLAGILGRQWNRPIAEFLSGRRSIQDSFLRYGQNLAIGADSAKVGLPAELLQGSQARAAMADLKKQLRPDIVLIDMPPLLGCDDVLAFLPNVDCVLIVVGAGSSTLVDVARCEGELAKETNILGTVLNKCRFVDRSGYY